MKFSKTYIDYTDAEIEVSETEMHRYFESALSNKYNRRPEDVAYDMAVEIYNDFDDDDNHDEVVEFENSWVSDLLVRSCEEYVNEHIDEFNNSRFLEDDNGQILLFNPYEYNK